MSRTREMRRWWMLVSVLLAVLTGGATAQVATTTVQDTVYRADGTPAGGTVLVSWGAFTTANGGAVPAGSTSVTIGSGGAFSVALAPNAGSTPMGNYYTVVYHLNDGTTSREFWVIPVAVPGGGPAKLAGIRNSVLPTSVAMQTVSKSYVDNAITAASLGTPLAEAPYVLKAGDTMTGPLQLPADPVSGNQAADKSYVDENVAAIASGLSQKVSTLPSSTQVVAQPTGTDLKVNRLNGELNASQYQSITGGDGIALALANADCATGCRVNVEPTYTANEGTVPANLQSQQHVVDKRDGSESRVALNPLAVGTDTSVAVTVNTLETLTGPQLLAQRPGAIGLGSSALKLTMQGLAGGSNLNPSNLETTPYGKSTYGTLQMLGVYNTQGQHVQAGSEMHCYGVGDCLAGSQIVYSSGGYRDNADEGAHPFDLFLSEDLSAYSGTCASGCTLGSTSLTVAASVQGTQGDGRFLIDTTPSKVISTGTLIGGGRTILGTAAFRGTSFPVSVFVQTVNAVTSQPGNMAPGTVSVPIQTSGVPSGFATNTAALPAGAGIACVADQPVNGQEVPNYEMAPYTVVDASHLQMTLNKPHGSPAIIAVGGLCGYGLEQTVDTVADSGFRQVFPVVGSVDATDLYYADALTTVVGRSQLTSGYLNVSLGVASIARSGDVVTVTTTANLPGDIDGLTLTVSGVSDASYNGSYVVSTTGVNSLTYANTGSNSTSTGGTLSLVTGGFALYPMAEVLSVFDPATKTVDGQFTLAPNTVAWAAGDTVEQPHYYQQSTFADIEYVEQFVPRPNQFAYAGKTYQGQVGPGVHGWAIFNSVPDSNYLGAGGTHSLPDTAYSVNGPWTNDMDMVAGADAVIRLHCNLHGCNRWDSDYSLFQMDSAVSVDSLRYSPQSSTATWNMQGQMYSFSPTAFTAGTINVTTLNAGTITGGVSGGAITSGTINVLRLPVFGPSGTTHAPGIVPDPGATAGSTHYLREDGTWAVPAGGGSGSSSGPAGGDLNGTYPNPTVAAVHATAGTLDGVTIGAVTPAPFTSTTFSIANALSHIVTFSIVDNWGPQFGTLDTLHPVQFVSRSIYVGNAGPVNTDSGSGNIFASGNVSAVGYVETLTTPSSSSASCTAGQFTDDANFHYVCVATNIWKRSALSSF